MVQVGVESENGWRPAKIGAAQLDRSAVPGTGIVIPLQQGLVSTVMKAFAADFHESVESLYNARGGADEGGWTPTNSVATSNHLNGTAMDLNWSDHPFGRAEAGYTQQKVVEVRKLLAFYTFEGLQLIWWGNDWDSPKDSMHFQMGYNTWQNQDVLRRFIAQRVRPDGFSTYRRGATPSVARKLVTPSPGGTVWADVSQYQGKPVDSSYPHKVLSFRTNSGDVVDTLAIENANTAKAMLDSGQLELVMPYYYFREGQANCDLHRAVLEQAGLFGHKRCVTMVDVEGTYNTGDCSWEINDEISRLREWYSSYYRVIGYYNSNADPQLWPTRGGINLVVPQYNRVPGDISGISDVTVRQDAIAHQYTDRATSVAPWNGTNVDLNWSPYTVPELLQLFDIQQPDTGGFLMALNDKQQQEIYDKIMAYPAVEGFKGRWPSRAIFADSTEGVDDTVGMLLNTDANVWDLLVIVGALAGVEEHIARVRRLANGEGPNGGNERLVNIAKQLLKAV